MIAYYHQSKKEMSYVYQIYVVITEAFEIFTYALYIVTCYWFSEMIGPGQSWPIPTFAD